ncbi:MAG: hypothetical protein IJ193_05475 [Bacilli bacterium]|nr:hypothetical protein [Bacilli bacterium]
MKKVVKTIGVFVVLILVVMTLPILFTFVYRGIDSLGQKSVRLTESGTPVPRAYASSDTDEVEEEPVKVVKTYKDLEFDSTYYPYYGMLNKRYRDLYKQIYFEVTNLDSVIKPNIEISRYDLPQVVEAVIYDHPELFYLSNRYSFKYNGRDIVYEITVKFNSLVNDYDANKERFETELNGIIQMANQYSTDYEKEKAVHDYLYEVLTYDSNASYSQSAYSALVNHNSVCAGYSKAFQLVMTRLGIPTYYVIGDSFGDHAWNLIRINDTYYNVDVTWDNTTYSKYAYFNISDSEIGTDHSRRGMAIYLPEADTSMFSTSSILYRTAF